MGELVRGSIADRPWGLTFGQFGVKQVTGQLTVKGADGRPFRVAFSRGQIVGATSGLAADAATRVAMTIGFLSSSQAPTVAKQIMATPEIDEIALLASACRLDAAQVMQLRKRVLVQRAARTFGVEQGVFVLEDTIEIPISNDADVDIRAVIYHGARMNLSETRLATELRDLGSHFTLNKSALERADHFGLDALEWPILDALRERTTVPELEARHRDLDPRNIQSVVYALVSSRDCDVEHDAITNFVEPRTTSPTSVEVSFKPSGRSGNTIPTANVPKRAQTEDPMRPAPITAGGGTPRVRPSSPYIDDPPVARAGTVTPATARGTGATTVPDDEPRVRTALASSPPPSRTTTPVPAPRTTTPMPAPMPSRTQTSPTAPPRTKPPSNPTFTQSGSQTALPRAGSSSPALPRAGSSNPAIPRATTSPPAIGRTPSTPPAISRTTSTGQLAIPRTTSAEREFSEGSDRITQSLAQAAEAFKLGLSALMANEVDLALVHLANASTLNPHEFDYSAVYAFAQFCAASSSDRTKSADKVRKMLNHALQKSVDPDTARFLLGNMEFLVGRNKEALAHFQAIIKKKPDHPEALAAIQAIEQKATEKSSFSLFRKK